MLISEIVGGWRPARSVPVVPSRAGWDAVRAREIEVSAGSSDGSPMDTDAVAAWNEVPTVDAPVVQAWGGAVGADFDTGGSWDVVARKDLLVLASWDRSIRARDTRLRVIYRMPSRRDTGRGLDWFRSDEHGPRRDAAAERLASLYIPGRVARFAFDGMHYVPGTIPMAWFDFRYVQPKRAIQPVDSGTGGRFSRAPLLNVMRVCPWGWGTPTDPVPTGIVYPDYPGPVVPIDPPTEPEILETYMIGNTVTLVVLPSRTPLDATSIRIGLDIDSFAWSFSADLFGRTSLDLAAPDANGPKTVELEINGWTWRFLVERYSGSGKHPSERYTISGASRTQLLDAPYAPKRSAVNTAPLNARQVVDEQLQYTGFSVSWDVENMGPPDWTLPAGAFSYQDQTPMQVIVKLAEVAGGIVRPGLLDDSVTILPRYREATWYWDTAIPDRIIPAAIVAEWGSEWSPQPAWNFVYVSGTSYGVSVQVRRAGTAGEESAPDVMEDWMTSTEVARSRGICELSKGGNQAIETRRIPLFQKDDGVPGLVQPGMLVEVRDEQATWRGLCLATDISAEGVGASRVWQTLRIERHYSGGS